MQLSYFVFVLLVGDHWHAGRSHSAYATKLPMVGKIRNINATEGTGVCFGRAVSILESGVVGREIVSGAFTELTSEELGNPHLAPHLHIAYYNRQCLCG